jgi:hypothetical protein
MRHFTLIDPGLSAQAIEKLKQLEIEPLTVPRTNLVDKPISGHPDIQIFIHEGTAFVHPGIEKNFLGKLGRYCDIKICSTFLTGSYPGDIAYNIASTGNYAFHKKNATDPVIKDYLKTKNISILEVKQGYSKCSTLIVNERSIITADNSIHNEAIKHAFDSLLISPGYIDLPGYKYGFIGGATGRFKNSIIFTGKIDHHPDREKIYNFIEGRGLTVTLLSDEPALDTGSLLISSY